MIGEGAMRRSGREVWPEFLKCIQRVRMFVSCVNAQLKFLSALNNEVL